MNTLRLLALTLTSSTLLLAPRGLAQNVLGNEEPASAQAWSRALISIDTMGLARLRAGAMADRRWAPTGIGLPGTRAALGTLTVGQDAYLKALNTGQDDEFGRTLAVSGDCAVIGAPFEASGSPGNPLDNNAPGAGAAYVFVRGPGGWSQTAYLKASNPDANDAFGSAVAIDGDTIVIGALREASDSVGVNGNQTNNLAPGAGAVYVFKRNGSAWNQEAYLKASNSEAGDSFGVTVSLSGDTLAVGAAFEDAASIGVNPAQNGNAATDAGAAYVFVRNGASWGQQAYIKASNTDAGDNFGIVALCGDTLAVGAISEGSNATGIGGNQANNSAPSAGAVYVYERSGTTWAHAEYLKASNAEASDSFGGRLALDANTLLVSAPVEGSAATGVDGDQSNNAIPGAGAAYVFARVGASWSQQAYLKASNPGPSDLFGISVSLAGDNAVVGALFEASSSTGVDGMVNDLAPTAGAAYLFSRSGTGWSGQAFLKASNTDAGDGFGISVAISGERLLVGASCEGSQATGVNGDQSDNTLTCAGAVYAFDVAPPACDSFCPSVPNATGFPAELSCSGDPASSLVITSAPVPNTPGQFFFGPTILAGSPFGDGVRCVGGAVRRVPGFVHAGMMMQPPNTAILTVDYGAPYASTLMGTQHFQHWFRSGTGTGSGFNTSNGLTVTF